MNFNRVVITGLGALTPIGNNIESYWNSLLIGKSGADFITRFNCFDYKTKFACELKNYDPDNFFSRKESKKLDRYSQYAIISSDEAINDSGLNFKKENLEKIGVIWSTGVGGLKSFENELLYFYNNNNISRFNSFFITKIIPNIASGHIAIKYGLKGPTFSTVASCSSSTNAIIDAYYLVKLGISDIMITGGSEAPITFSSIGGFNSIKALSCRNQDPKTASRPFDKNRDGFVIGEGSGAIILEEYYHAKSRGAKIYAEFLGSGMSSDAYHIVSPHPYSDGFVLSMKKAIKNSKILLNDIDYINVHGTSTKLGDLSEIKAIHKVFKNNIYNISISSTKSMTGHLLGASGCIEILASIFSICNQIIPPNINYFTYDDLFDKNINFVFNEYQKKDVNFVLSNTFGFGGHNCSIVLRKY